MRDMRFIFPLLWALFIWRMTMTPKIIVTDNSLFQMILMNGAHFVFFGIQAILCLIALNYRTKYTAAIIITSVYGLVIEILQQSIAGRTTDPIDWLLDTLGAFTFVYLVRKYGKYIRVKGVKI